MQTTKKEFDGHQKHLKRTHTDGSQYLTSFFLAFPVVSPLLVSFALFLLQSNGSIFLVTDSHLFFRWEIMVQRPLKHLHPMKTDIILNKLETKSEQSTMR